MSVINQKEYLKKYLSLGDEKEKSKKRKKKARIIQNRVKIIDDDIDVPHNVNEEEMKEFLTAEDAPLVVGMIDDRPLSMRIDDYRKSDKWKLVGSDDELKEKENESKERIKQNRQSDSDASPPRKSRRSNKDDDLSPPRNKNEHSANRKSRFDNSDTSPPRRSKKYDSDTSPVRKLKKRFEDASPPRRSRKDSDSDVSPPRKIIKEPDSYASLPKKIRRDTDVSPPRKSRRDSDVSPLRKSKRDSDVSPLRKSKRDSDVSPPRKSRRDSDVSPPRKSRKHLDSNVSPPRKFKRQFESDTSPPRRPRKMSNIDSSPPRNNRNNSNSETKPARKSRWSTNTDLSPPRKSDKYLNSSSSKSRTKFDSDKSPPRRNKSNDRYENRKENYASSSKQDKRSLSPETTRKQEKSQKKMTKTLDGKTAGIQFAGDLKKETVALKKREDEMFKNMSAEISGKDAVPVMRDRKTGKKRDLEKEAMDEYEKQQVENERKAKYDKWGKGLKQVEDHKEKIQQELHEMSKPLARYADDEDLEKYLKDQEREGDPMLQYIRKKKRQDAEASGQPLDIKLQYNGEFMPNRFGIPPGHRWDGVDRSNGYEKEWFKVLNSKKAVEEDIYKWSTEDM